MREFGLPLSWLAKERPFSTLSAEPGRSFTKRAHIQMTAIWAVAAIVGVSKHHYENAKVNIYALMTALANIRAKFSFAGM